jgi:hypothetical protein
MNQAMTSRIKVVEFEDSERVPLYAIRWPEQVS